MGLASASVVALSLVAACYVGADGDGTGTESAGASSGRDTVDAGDAGEDESGGEGETGDDETVPADFEPSPGTMRRLTTRQYVNSIQDVFGLDITDAVQLDVDETSTVFRSIGAGRVGTSPSGVEMYRTAAFVVATQVFENRDAYDWLSQCTPTSGSDACVRGALADLGLRLWRRPLEADELDRYAALIDAPYEDGVDPEYGFQYAIAALVESPNFIYLPAVGEPTSGDLHRYTGWEMASRLAYTLWDTTPDEPLLEAAADGSLVTAAGIEAQARRMLNDPKAKDVLVRFFGEAWNVERLSFTTKNPDSFESWSDAALADYKTEFRLVLEDLMARDGDVRGLFDGATTLANPALAELYGLTPGSPADAVEGEFTTVDLGDRRHGLLTSGAVLAANSPSDRSSPTIRGVFVLERLLCGEVPPPPADVDDSLPTNDGEPKSTRDKLEEHRVNPACAGCHALMDPLGLVLEHYDGIGLWRDDEDGFEIDPSGEYGGVQFNAASDLATFLGSDAQATKCVARHALSFAAGRELHGSDADELEALDAVFEGSGYQMRELMVGVVTSPSFRYLIEDAQ